MFIHRAGVLTDHTPARKEGAYHRREHIVRPHIEQLLRLREVFDLGVYSSATIRTVRTAIGIIERTVTETMQAQQPGKGKGQCFYM